VASLTFACTWRDRQIVAIIEMQMRLQNQELEDEIRKMSTDSSRPKAQLLCLGGVRSPGGAASLWRPTRTTRKRPGGSLDRRKRQWSISRRRRRYDHGVAS
jgi:hypothetical protein